MAGKAIEARPWAWHSSIALTLARGQRPIFTLVAGIPDRADGVNHMPRRQPIRFGDLGSAGLAAMKRAALGEKRGPGRAMDRPVHTAAAEQRAIRGVDDGVNAQCR